MIRKAKEQEHSELTKISNASKRYWKYPEAYLEIWQKELTLTPHYIKSNDVFVSQTDDTLCGYYSIVELEKDLQIAGLTLQAGIWLDHMFILPSFIGQGIGRELFIHCIERCRSKAYPLLKTLADPNAKGFYLKMGCSYIAEYPSTIPNRTTPLLEFSIDKS